MLTVDLSIRVFGVDRLDSAGPSADSDPASPESGAESVSRWEAELLREMLRECLRAANEEDEDAKTHVGGTKTAHLHPFSFRFF